MLVMTYSFPAGPLIIIYILIIHSFHCIDVVKVILHTEECPYLLLQLVVVE